MAQMKTLAAAAICAHLLICIGSAQVNRSAKITGTYTDMYYNRDGGDLLGTELKIVFTSKGYQGVIQFGHGGASPLMIVEIKVNGNKIQFDIPLTQPPLYPTHFEGTVDATGLKGIFRIGTIEGESVILKRSKSYWD